MSPDIAISVENVSKAYRIWNDPAARLQSPLLRTAAGLLPQGSKLRNGIEGKASRYYRDFYALRDISFQVRKGESVGIIGRNGSGKSTLLQIIAGTLQPTAGSVKVNGRVAALLELGSGFNPEFTGRENVYLNAAVLGLSREETDARFDNIAAFADIGDFLDQPVKTYSSGMIMRIAFAIQTAVDPQIMIIDEALSVGDESFQRKCFARLEKLKATGSSLLFVSHSAAQIIELCNHAILINKGHILIDGLPKSVVTRYHQQLYAAPPANETIQEQSLPYSDKTNTNPEWQVTTLNPPPNNISFYNANAYTPATISYPQSGAIISSPNILDLSGRLVNHITRGKSYLYQYDVDITMPIKGVRFGAMIKTITGLEFGGMASHCHLERIAEVYPGQKFKIRFRFTCRMIPGTYFINAGVLALSGTGEEYFAHRLIDAISIKVQYEPDLPVNGLVDLLDYVEIAQHSFVKE
jgi:lipopolysaccharide transport system ATP-binding protein